MEPVGVIRMSAITCTCTVTEEIDTHKYNKSNFANFTVNVNSKVTRSPLLYTLFLLSSESHSIGYVAGALV